MALACLLSDETRRRAMGEAGRAMVERRFRAEAIAREVEGVYEEVLARALVDRNV